MGLTADALTVAPVIKDEHRIWFNPNQNDAWFMAITEMLTIITLFGILELVFHMPIKGSQLLFLGTPPFTPSTSAGIGLFIATIARNLAQVGVLTVLVFAPMIFLSGAWTPPEAMPAWMRLFMGMSPLHYYTDACLGILLKGAGIGLIWDSIIGIVIVIAESIHGIEP